MKKLTIYILIKLLILFNMNCSKKENTTTTITNNNNKPDAKTENIEILDQEQYERDIVDANFDLICKVELGDEMVFKPYFCEFDNAGNIYIMDYSSFLIHKFSLNNNEEKKYSHSVFGKGEGLGPGEFSNPTDFKIYKNKIYIANPPTGAVEIYSTEGNYLKRIKPSEEFIPDRVAIIGNKLILKPQSLINNDPFYAYSYSGNFLFSFGALIDKTNKSGLYHSSYIFQINENSFYYLPLYLGFIGLYQNENLVFAKATIDGLKQPKLIKKNVLNGMVATKVQEEYITASHYACNDSYLILRSVSKNENKTLHDVYSVDSFDYLYTLKNFPSGYHFDIHENYLACIDKFSLRVYKYSF